MTPSRHPAGFFFAAKKGRAESMGVDLGVCAKK